MSRLFVYLVSVSVISFFLSPAVVSAEEENVLVKAKCNKCHSVSVLKIEKTKEKSKAPDLSSTGKFHDAEFLKAYLKKKIEHVAHEGLDSTKKHKTKAKAEGEELDAMVKVLLELKGE